MQPARVQMLRDWRDAGYVLGNHTYSHMDLNAKGVAAFQQDFLRGETVLRPLLAEKGRCRSGCATLPARWPYCG